MAPQCSIRGSVYRPTSPSRSSSQVGNYGEIFAEHLTPLGLERGLNALWTDGGLIYAPPYR